MHVARLPEASGEEPLISALFTNLLSNALKYGPRARGKILVDATSERQLPEVLRPEPGRDDPGRGP